MLTRHDHLIGTLCLVLAIGLATGCERSEPTSPATPTGSAPAGSAGAAAHTTNAADEYRSLRNAMDAELVTLVADSKQELSPTFCSAVEAAQPVIDRLVWATALEQCDWEIDYSAGVDTKLPHLKGMRTLTRLLQADARCALQRNDSATAAADLAAIANMSRHVNGKSIIETLVAGAMLRVATDIVTEHAGIWTKADRAVLRTALKQIDGSDPFAGKATLVFDKRISIEGGIEPTDEAQFNRGMQKVKDGLRAALTAVE